jgi:hypothetical protein
MSQDLHREALAVLAEVWALSPDVRLGQLFAHLGFLGEAHLGRGLGYIEDDEFLAILYRHRAELEARSRSTSDTALQRTGPATSVSGSPTLVEAAPPTELGR